MCNMWTFINYFFLSLGFWWLLRKISPWLLTLCFCPGLWSSSPSLRLSASPAGGTTGRRLPCFWWRSPPWAAGSHCKYTVWFRSCDFVEVSFFLLCKHRRDVCWWQWKCKSCTECFFFIYDLEHVDTRHKYQILRHTTCMWCVCKRSNHKLPVSESYSCVNLDKCL